MESNTTPRRSLCRLSNTSMEGWLRQLLEGSTFRCVLLLPIILILSLSTQLYAGTITSNGTGGGNWGTASSWSGGILPATTDHVIIAASDQINIAVSQTCVNLTVNGTLNMNTNSRTLTVNGRFTMNGTGSILGSNNTRIINIAGPMIVASGANANIAGCVFSVTGTTTVDGSLTFSNNTSTKTFTGNVTVNGSVLFTTNQTLTLGGQLITADGSTIGNIGNVGTLNVATGLLAPVGATRKLINLVLNCSAPSTITGTVVLGGGTFTFTSIQISGSGELDASSSGNVLRVSGHWEDVSSAADPFVEGTTSLVTFNGASGTQKIVSANGMESFNNLVFANTSGAVPAIVCLSDITATNDLDHTSGVLDLNGKTLTLTGSASAQTHTFSNASMISNSNGASFNVTDPSNINMITFTGYRIGDASIEIPVNIKCGRIILTGFKQWGKSFFTKTQNIDDVFGGGNYYNGPVTFTAASTASRWRMGDNVAQPDTFVNATFNANALGGSNNNFIICANSLGNAFYGTTSISSSTIGGFYICRSNGNGLASATFFGPVVARVTLSGSVVFANSATGNSNAVTFHNTVQATSASNSTGDIYFGDNAQSSVMLSPTAQFIQGSLQGQPSVYFRNVIQTGSLAQTMIGVNNSRIYCGGTNYPTQFNGPVQFIADTLIIDRSTFNGRIDATGLSHILLGNSAFNSGPNVFTKQGTGNSASNGGNSFAAGNSSRFVNTGTGYMRLASSVADDVNGNVTYFQSGTGLLFPAYGPYSTYAGDISTVGSPVAITIGSALLDGSAQIIDGDAARPPTFNNLTTALSGTVKANVDIKVKTLLRMNTGLINMNTKVLTLGTATNSLGTLTYTGGWIYGGTMTRWFPATAVTLGNVAGLFPMGSPTTHYRPFWFGSTANLTTGGTVSINHTPTTSGSIPASHYDPSWVNTVNGVSHAAWLLTSANGLAINGSTGSIKYGGQGFSPFVLADLNATQATSVIGTHSAATNVVVPLEVSRRLLNTVAVNRTWLIGTRDLSTSPLPIELISFEAKLVSDKVELAWITGSEMNNDHFTIERSRDGEHFEHVLNIDGAGNSFTALSYAATDEHPLGGLSYYRLKQVDIDGSGSTSDMVPIMNIAHGNDLLVYPNPHSDGPLTLVFPNEPNSTYLLNVVDASGRMVIKRVLSAVGGTSMVVDGNDMDELSPGIYNVILEGDSDRFQAKLTVQ